MPEQQSKLPRFTYRYVIEGELPGPSREAVMTALLDSISIKAGIAPSMTKLEVDAQPKSNLITPNQFDTNGVRIK